MNDMADGFHGAQPALRRSGSCRVARPLAEQRWPEAGVRTSQERVQALVDGTEPVAESAVFWRDADDRAVLLVTSADGGVGEERGAAVTCAPSRADLPVVDVVLR